MDNYTKMNEEENKCIDKECMICFEEVNTKKDYIKCYNCMKLFHVKCMNDWRLKKIVDILLVVFIAQKMI